MSDDDIAFVMDIMDRAGWTKEDSEAFRQSLAYPEDLERVVALGHRHYLLWDDDHGGFLWHHPACKAWASLRFKPDPRSTGHALLQADPLTVEGSLVCPMGCGDHGFIRNGAWVPA